MTSLKTIITRPAYRKSAISFGLRIAQAILVLCFTALVARGLGVEGFGRYMLFATAATFSAPVLQWGFNHLQMLYIGRGDRHIPDVRRTAMGFALMACSVGVAIASVLVGVGILSITLYTSIVLTILTTGSMAIGAFKNGENRSIGRPIFAMIATTVFPLGLSLFIAGAIYLSQGKGQGEVNDYLGAFAAGWMTAAIASTLAFRMFLKVDPNERSRAMFDAPGKMSLGVFRAGLSYMAAGLLNMTITHSSFFITNAMAGADQAGLLRAAAQVAATLLLATQALVALFGHRFADLHARGDTGRMASLSSRMAFGAGTFAGLGALAFLLLGEAMIGVAFGPEFESAFPALLILAFAQVIANACGPVAVILGMTRNQKYVVAAYLCAALVTVLGTLAATPHFGVLGAASASAAGLMTWNIGLAFVIRRRLGFDPSILGLLKSTRQ